MKITNEYLEIRFLFSYDARSFIYEKNNLNTKYNVFTPGIV